MIIQARKKGILDQLGSSGSGEKWVELERFAGCTGRGKLRGGLVSWPLTLSSGTAMLASLPLTSDMAILTLRWQETQSRYVPRGKINGVWEHTRDCPICHRDPGAKGHRRQHSSSWLLMPLEIRPQLPTVASYELTLPKIMLQSNLFPPIQWLKTIRVFPTSLGWLEFGQGWVGLAQALG